VHGFELLFIHSRCVPLTCLQAYAVEANFENADMTNAVVDRVDFSKANMR
jgi:uncharacterized protein YjbI with pentapeptide repeats